MELFIIRRSAVMSEDVPIFRANMTQPDLGLIRISTDIRLVICLIHVISN